MLDHTDITRIIEAQREVFATKEDFAAFQEDMRKNFSHMVTSIDAYAKKADTYFQEMVVLGYQVSRHERWLKQIAERLELKLEY